MDIKSVALSIKNLEDQIDTAVKSLEEQHRSAKDSLFELLQPAMAANGIDRGYVLVVCTDQPYPEYPVNQSDLPCILLADDVYAEEVGLTPIALFDLDGKLIRKYEDSEEAA